MKDNNLLPALPDSLTAEVHRDWVKQHQPEIDLMRWSTRPARRRTAQEQAARTTWRMLRVAVIVFFIGIAVVSWVYTLISSDNWGITGLCGLLAVITMLIDPEAPEWFIRLYKEVG